MTKFKLSDYVFGVDYPDYFVIDVEYIKEFIKRLKEEIKSLYSGNPKKDHDLIHINEIIIDKLTGDLK